jgi:hypothetical protein
MGLLVTRRLTSRTAYVVASSIIVLKVFLLLQTFGVHVQLGIV